MSTLLWTDERVELVSERGLNLVNPQFYYVNRMIVTDMRDEYEAEIAQLCASRLAIVESLDAVMRERDLLKAQLAATWQPITEQGTELIGSDVADDDWRLYVYDNGTGIEFIGDKGRLEGYFSLPTDCAVCRKVTP